MSIVEACASEGALVACLARREDRVETLAKAVRGYAIIADVTDEEQVRRGIDQAADLLGGIDGVVNSAGVYAPGRIGDGRFHEWKRMFEVNLLGTLAVIQASMPYLRQQANGDIVIVGSLAAHRVVLPEATVYSATKSALRTLCDGLRLELHPFGIRVSLLSPGLVITELGADATDAGSRRAFRQRQEERGMDPKIVACQAVRVMSAPWSVTLREVVVVPTNELP